MLVWHLGTGPFLDGIRHVSAGALLAALILTALTTLCCAWRWRLVAGGLGVDVPLTHAMGACYRSQFLNSALPGGVVGDVHRGVRHGRSTGDLGRGLRSVAWERTSGQTVQIVVTAAVLMIAVLPRNTWVPSLATLVVVGGAVVLVVRRTAPPAQAHGGAQRGVARIGALVATDLRDVVLARRVWPGLVVTSVLALAGYVALFAVALRSTGMQLPAGMVLPLALTVLLAAAIPLSIAGWGPREGGAAWAFGVAGLTAAQGVTVAVAYGVLVVASTLPGAVLLLVDRRGRGSSDRRDGVRREGLQGEGLQGEGLQGEGLQGKTVRREAVPRDGVRRELTQAPSETAR